MVNGIETARNLLMSSNLNLTSKVRANGGERPLIARAPQFE